MPSISKLSDTSYKINVTEGDITNAFPANFTDIDPIIEVNTSGKVITGDVSVEFSKDAADNIRAKVSQILTLGLDMGDRMAENKFLEALYNSPLPAAGSYDGDVPTLVPEDEEAISLGLNAIDTTFVFSLPLGVIGVGDRYRLKFIPDARGFDVVLENIDLLDSLVEDHPYALTSSFIISSLAHDNPVVSDGFPGAISLGSVNDAKVFFYEKDFYINIGEALSRAAALSGLNHIGSLHDAYHDLFSLSMWRTGDSIQVEETDKRPFTTHLCGIDPSRGAIQYLPISGLAAHESMSKTNTILTGEAKVKFLVGDIRYPFKAIFGNRKVLFDICIDDPGWTDVGPLADQYIGGVGVEGGDTIHTWTGRKSIIIRRESLSAIGQSKLGE